VVAVIGASLGTRRVDVVIRDGEIAAVTESNGRPPPADEVVHADGGAIIPGLHDHHLHLMALAAARGSVVVGPPEVHDAGSLAAALRRAVAVNPGSLVRGVGYHESVAGDLDRRWLDRVAGASPVRIQHRTGMLWILNTAALQLAARHGTDLTAGERDEQGEMTGRFFRADAELRRTDPGGGVPDLDVVARELLAHGVTSVTDLTPVTDAADWPILAGQVLAEGFPLLVTVTGAPAVVDADFAGLEAGPVKVVLDDYALPGIDELVHSFGIARRAGRAVAVHTVSRGSLVLALAAFESVGPASGDRIEHGAVIPVELFDVIREFGLTVVTQPALACSRGDDYLREVDLSDRPDLWRAGSLIRSGIGVALSSDAPYGPLDPWLGLHAAMNRITPAGVVLGPAERVAPDVAIRSLLTGPRDPAGVLRTIAVGQPGHLVVLDRPLDEVLRAPTADSVCAVVAHHGAVLRR